MSLRRPRWSSLAAAAVLWSALAALPAVAGDAPWRSGAAVGDAPWRSGAAVGDARPRGVDRDLPRRHRVAPLGRPAERAPRDLHAEAVRIRAAAANDARVRDAMRAIEDGVLRRHARPGSLVWVGARRHLEEERAALATREDWRRLDAAGGWPGGPTGPVTRRVLERAGVELWLDARHDAIDRDVDAVADGIAAGRDAAPGLDVDRR